MLFGTDGIRGIPGEEPLDSASLQKLSCALANFAKQNHITKAVIVRDTRASGNFIMHALASGLAMHGISVELAGILPTAAASMLAFTQGSLGIVVSASHNPAQYNGIKFFTPKGEKLSKSEEATIERFFAKRCSCEASFASIGFNENAEKRYLEFLSKLSIKNDFNIAIDCANGAASYIAKKLFSKAAGKTHFTACEPDGYNINANCGALYPASISSFVEKVSADFGFAFDGDADRLLVCDEKAKALAGEHLIAAFAKWLLRKSSKKCIVTTKLSNSALDEYLAEQGIKVYRSNVGDANVYALMKKTKAYFGAEPSGHFILAKYSRTADALLAALIFVKMLKETEVSASALAEQFELKPQAKLNVQISKKIPFKKLPKFQKALVYAKNALPKNSRVIVRYSGTEPIARILVECESKKLAEEIANYLALKLKEALANES